MKQLWSIRTQAKTMQVFLVVMGVVTIAVCGMAMYSSNQTIQEAKRNIYILKNNNRLIEAVSSDLDNSYDILVKGQIEEINKLIFEHIPDPGEINKKLDKARTIGDDKVAQMIDGLKTNRYYNNLISQNYFTVLLTDSISVNYSSSIHPFTYYGKIKIIRNNQIFFRQITTQGLVQYTNVRTPIDNRGFLIKDMKTIQYQIIE